MIDFSGIETCFGCLVLTVLALVTAVVALLGVALQWWGWVEAGQGASVVLLIATIYCVGQAAGARR